MSKRGLFVLAFALFLFAFVVSSERVSASQGISVVDVNSSYSAVYVSNPDNMFAYEINFIITSGSTNSVGFANFFGAGVTTTRGSSLDSEGTKLTIYESILGNGGVGITRTGTYNLFNVSHSGNFSLEANLLIANNKVENVPAICGNGVAELGEDCDGSDLNSGTCISEGYGSGSLSCDSDCAYITSMCIPLPSCSDGVCNGAETCSSCSSDCGSCSVEGAAQQSSGGGGGGALAVVDIGISVSPRELAVSVLVGQEDSRTVTIRNGGKSSVTLDLTSAGLNAESTLDKTQITLASGESQDVTLSFRDLRKGIYAGRIIIKSQGTIVKEIPIILDMRSENFLFDSKISISDGRYVLPGQDLVAKIDLKEIAVQKEPVNVTINYLIKGFDGTTFLEQSESFPVTSLKSYTKIFPTVDLPLGKYVLGMEVIYPGAFATSSTQFSIVSVRPSSFSLALIMIIVMAVVLVGTVFWAARRGRSNKLKRAALKRR